MNKYYNVVKHPSKYDENEWNTLFVMSRCVCRIEKNNLCNCTACNKIPDDTKTFFIDQCGPRLMTLDNVDVRSTNDIQQMTTVCSSNTIRSDVYSIEYLPDSEEQEFEENVSVTKKNISLRNFCSALDRSDTCVRYGALLATILIKDLRISIAAKAKQEESAESLAQINELFDGLIIDKNKVYRERVKFRKEALAAAKCDDSVKCISFDGKKEKTLKRVTEANVIRNVVLNEEHITIVKEPGSKFLGYATPTESSATGIQKSIVGYLEQQHTSTDDLVAICCDGTPTNTGYKGGVVAKMECHLQRPLQWFVCLFHFNELPFNALLRSLLGRQKDPGVWPGNIGACIQNCMLYSVKNNFQRIPRSEMPDNIEDFNIRGDQLYLYRMVRAVHTGECDESLASEKPGAMSTARWLTTASRILRYYITCEQSPITLKTLADFIVKVYASFWFLVKNQPLAIHECRHVFKYITWICQLPQDIQNIVRPVIKNNSCFHTQKIF